MTIKQNMNMTMIITLIQQHKTQNYNREQVKNIIEMGAFISTISQPQSSKLAVSETWCESLQKIKEYHGMFKYVCDSFIITSEQCNEIFGSAEKCKIWDPDNIGKIDALQIFCGLTVFARDATWKRKLSFLFSIFDFNQIKSLGFIDVEVIVLNVCNSAYKILGKNGKANQNQIADWLSRSLYKKERVKITRLYKLCLENEDIAEFFKTINQLISEPLQFPTRFSSQQLVSASLLMPTPTIPQGVPSAKQRDQIIENIEWHRDLINRIVKVEDLDYCQQQQFCNNYFGLRNQPQSRNGNGESDNNRLSHCSYNYYENNYGCKISWVYGINTAGLSRPFVCLRKMGGQIGYRISSMLVVQDLERGKQSIMEGHQQQIACIAYNQKYQVFASAGSVPFPSIHIWQKVGASQSSNCDNTSNFHKVSQIATTHSHGIKFMEFIARESLLATVGTREQQSPILIYDFIRSEVVYQIILPQSIIHISTPLALVEKSIVTGAVYDSIFCLAQDQTKIYEINLKPKQKPGNQFITFKPTQIIAQHSYATLQTTSMSRQTNREGNTPYNYNFQAQTKTNCDDHANDRIRSVCTVYCNVRNPYLRSHCDKSISMVVLTGHQSKSVCMMRLPAKLSKDRSTSKYRQQENSDSRQSVINNQINTAETKQEKIIISQLDGSVSCLKVTSEVLVVAAGSCIYVYNLEILNTKAAPLLMANLKAQQKVELLSQNISYFDFVQSYILAMTEKGQFLKVQTHRSIRTSTKRNSTINRMSPGYIEESNENQLQASHSHGVGISTQNLQVTMIDKLIKLEVLTNSSSNTTINDQPQTTANDQRNSSCSHSNIFCILNLNPSMSQEQPHQLLLFVSYNNRILGIDSLSRDVMELWEINAAQTIATLDAVCSDEGSCYVICGCRSGRLYIRIDWEQNPKFYDCGSEIVDAKISKDCSYLLVATKSNYLLFFAQVNKVFTSPRKLLFEYQTPCSINFLDNFKFFLIVTSAKNCYLIEIPQLKHKKLQKQTQKISISKVSIKYPYVNQKVNTELKGAQQQAQNGSGNQNKNNINFSTSIFGGNMKFSLISHNISSGNLYFFPSPSALERNTFTVLNAHKCPIAHMIVNEHQNKFYTLGDSDNMLVQWSIFTNRFQNCQTLEKSHSNNNRYKNARNRNYEQYGQDECDDSHYRNIRSKCNIQPSNLYTNFQEMEQYYNYEQFNNRTMNLKLNNEDNAGRNGLGNGVRGAQLFYFKGTKLQKINENIDRCYQSYLIDARKKGISFKEKHKGKQAASQKEVQVEGSQGQLAYIKQEQKEKQSKPSPNLNPCDEIDSESYNKRAPGVSLHVQQVFGLSTLNKESIFYCSGSNGEQILGYNSRFIIRMHIKQKTQIIYQPTSKCINNVIRLHHTPNFMLYTVVELRPRIYVLELNTDVSDDGPIPKNRSILTTHEKGIMHLTACEQFVLSYGISEKGYSINLHNFMTGELIASSYTDIRVAKFLVLPINKSGCGSSRPANFTMVSLPEVRVWQELYPSQPVALASSGCILPNGHDILLGLQSGKLLILDTRKTGGLHQIQPNAHEKAIDFVAVKSIDNSSNISSDDSFEIVTVGRDQKIKIWSSCFEVKVLIELRHKQNLIFHGENNKELLMLENIVAKSLDIYRNKLLLGLSSGHISEIQLENTKTMASKGNDFTNSKHPSNCSNISQKSFTNQSISNQLQQQQQQDQTQQQISQFSIDQSNKHANGYGRTKFKWTNIFHVHTTMWNQGRRANSNNNKNNINMTGHAGNRGQMSQSRSPNAGISMKTNMNQPCKAQYFSINNLYPLIVTCGEDNQVIIRNYETGQVVYKCYYEKQKVQAVKFCKRGTKLAIGFSTGDLKLYEVKVYKDTLNSATDNNTINMNATNIRSNTRNNTYVNKKGKVDNVMLKLYQTIQQCETNNQGQSIGKQASKYPQSDSSKGEHQSSHSHNSNHKQQYFKHNRSNGANNDRFRIVNIEFSQCSTYLAVSYIYMYDQVAQRCRSSIAVYKIRQSSKVGTINNISYNTDNVERDEQKLSMKNIQSHDELQLQYYVKVGTTIQITSGDQDMNMTHSSKYIKSAYFMTFMKESQPIESNSHDYVGSGRTLSIPKSSNMPMKTQANQKFQLSQMYLLFYEQYMDMSKQRVHNDNKIKLKVYQVQDGPSVKEDFNINLLKWKFPHFIDARAVQGVIQCSAQNKRRPIVNGKQIEGNSGAQDEIRFAANQDKAQLSVIVSDMLIHDQMVIYGDTNGKIHIVKIHSLQQQKKQCETELKPEIVSPLANRLQLSQMNLSKTYNSNIGPISQIELSADRRYLFVSGTTDNCIVKYRIKTERSDEDIDNICYPLNFKDVHGEYICKSKFYQFLNSIDPIRQQISEIMLDVEDHDRNRNNGVQLQPLRIFGRRAFDRRNNLFQDKRGNLIYSLGPNIIIQNPNNPLLQTHIPVDPNPYSNSPQISCMCYSCGYLVASTEQENSRLFVWDISSKTCLQELCLNNFSIVYHMTPVFNQKIIFVYGINYLYEPYFQLIDWDAAKILGSYSGLYSGVWKIKDMCQVSNLAISYTSPNSIPTSSLDFVSCGVQHLMHWTYTAENLQCQTFGLADLEMKQTTFMCVSNLGELILTGAENGIIYGFSGFQCVMQLKMHTGPIRSIVLDYGITQGNSYAYSNVMVYSGGMDGKVCVSGISLDENQNYVIRKLQEYSIKSKQSKASHMASAHKQSRMKKFSSNQIQTSMISAQSDIILAEQDIQSLVISKCLQTDQNNKIPMINIYIGTRSGNILLVKRQSVSMNQKNINGLGNRKQIGTSNNLSNVESTKQISRRNSSGGAHSMQRFAIAGEPTLITSCHDNDTISSLVFSEQNPNIFYLLTSSGVLEVWSLLTMKRIFIYKLSQQAKKIFTFGQHVIICCERNIRTVKIDLDKLSVNYVTAMSKDYDGSITDCCMSKIVEEQNINTNSNARTTNYKNVNKNESQESEQGRTQPNNESVNRGNKNMNNKVNAEIKDTNKSYKKFIYFVVSLKKSQFSEILISTITLPNQQYETQSQYLAEPLLQLKFSVLNLKYELQFMDFSVDNKYLLFKDSFEELGMVNLENFKRINTIFVEMGIQWKGEGIRISPNGQMIYCSYSRENRITVLRRISNKEIIVGDEMGTLRIFDYPCPNDKIGELHTQCYTSHMNFIKNIEIHPILPFALTTSIYDSSLILWKINKSEHN